MARSRVKSVRRIVVLNPDGDAETLYRSRKKKKQSRVLKPLARARRRLAKAVEAGAEDYIDRHDRSNRKKKDGWARDSGKNNAKAMRKGLKKLTK